MFQTEHEFKLPFGYVDEDGTLHREGIMRLATAADEILPLKDPRVQSNQAYLVVILISRVVTRLGGIAQVTPKVIEGLDRKSTRLNSSHQKISYAVLCLKKKNTHLTSIPRRLASRIISMSSRRRSGQ